MQGSSKPARACVYVVVWGIARAGRAYGVVGLIRGGGDRKINKGRGSMWSYGRRLPVPYPCVWRAKRATGRRGW